MAVARRSEDPRHAPQHEPDVAAMAALHALGVVALATDDPQRAADVLLEAAVWAGGIAVDEAVACGLPGSLIEALGRIGDGAALRACAAELRERGRHICAPLLLAWAAHANALALGSEGDAAAALDELEAAVAHAERAREPFELARVLVTVGQSERRLRRKRAAQVALERACELLEQCGATLWLERAQLELARARAERPPARGLTVTERRVCERAAEGRSNAEIGAELFLSRRTVEVNLARAYSKLGIRNRAQLGGMLTRTGSVEPGAATSVALQSARAILLGRAGGEVPARSGRRLVVL